MGREVIEVFSNTAYADMHLARVAKRNRATVEMRL